MKRRKMKRGKDRRVFSRTAQKVHGKNMATRPMRGGWRL